MANRKAPKGKVFQCMACGKRSKDEFGYKAIDYGWDESCMLKCELVTEKQAAKNLGLDKKGDKV